MTYNDLKALAMQVEPSGDNLFRESSSIAKTSLELAILENKIDKHLCILKEKMNKDFYGDEDVLFFHEKINRCLSDIDEFLNNTVERVPLYRENKINAFFKAAYLYLKQIWDRIVAAFKRLVEKFKKGKTFKGGEKVTPDKEVQKETDAKIKKAVDEFVNNDDLKEAMDNAPDGELSADEAKHILSAISDEQKKSGEIVFAKNIYNTVYASQADIDDKRVLLDEVMKTYDIKKLSKMFVDHVKKSSLLKSDLAKYVRVLKMCKESDDIKYARTIMGNMMLEFASRTFFADETTHKVNFFDVEVTRLNRAFHTAEKKFSKNSEYGLNRALDTLFGDKDNDGDLVFDTLKVIDNLSKVVDSGDKDYIKPMRVPVQIYTGMFKALPNEDTLDKWGKMCFDIMNVDLNQWYGNQLGMFKSIAEGMSAFNKVSTAKPTAVMAHDLAENKMHLTDYQAYMTWSDILTELTGHEAMKNLAPSSMEKVSKAKLSAPDANFDLFNKVATYSELLDIIQATDEGMYNKVPHTLKPMVKDTNTGLDTAVLDETIKKATTLFQVRLADETSVSADTAKRVKESIAIRTEAVKEFMLAITNSLRIAEARRDNYRQIMTSFLEVLVADLGINQFGILTVIEHIVSDKYLLESALTEICGA